MRSTHVRNPILVSAAVTLVALLAGAPASAQNDAPNPYETVEGWAKLPDGREWGAISAIYPTNDGEHIWIAERCGANLCVGSDVDPVMLFDMDGNVVRSFGSGMAATDDNDIIGLWILHDSDLTLVLRDWAI